MSYFTQDFIDFFKELSQNNHKEWFHANKKRYEASVKNPFYALLGDIIKEFQKEDPLMNLEVKNAVARINRDIRFSKDKTPYNTHVTAFISREGKKNKSIPGLFLRFSPEMVGIMGGCYGPDKEQLIKLRTVMSQDGKAFRKLINAKSFKNKFGEIQGDVSKRIPKEFKEAAQIEPLVANKQFYFVAEREPELLLQKDLLKEIMKYWKTMKPVSEFLKNAIK